MSANRRSRAQFVEPLEDRRLLSGGTLDPSFGKNGITTVPGGSLKLTAVSVATRSDGKVIILGEDNSQVAGVFIVPRVVLARLNSDGSLDKTFGTNGIALVSDLPNFSDSYALAIQSDNKIVVVGDHTVGTVFSGKTDAQVIRFTANGQIDTSFGNNHTTHISTFDVGDDDDSSAHAVAIQRDGKIVIAGQALNNGFLGGFNHSAFIARLNSNGTLDTSFADGGVNLLDMNENDVGQALAINYNGSSSNSTYGEIMMAGYTGDFNTFASKMFVVRFLKNGKVDGSFGHGIVTARFGSSVKFNDARALVIQSDSKTVVAAAVAGQSNFNKNFGIARFNNDGTLDKSFGGSSTGLIQVDFGGDDQADSVVVNDTGELLVGGSSESKTAVVLLSKVGKPDPAFGPNANGKVTVGVQNKMIAANGIALSPGGKFVVAGGPDFTTERFYDRSPATVSIKVLDADASETNKDPGSFVISRLEKLNTTTRVYYSLGGSATSPFSLLRTQIDYTGPVPAPPPVIGTGGSTGISHLGQGYVDIPPGQTQATVTITPNDDSRVESDEAVQATLVTDPGYDINPTFPSGVVVIHDNDGAPATTLNDTADAYVRDGTNAGANFGTAKDLEVKKGGSGFNRVSYIKFDLSGVSAINSVKLNLFGKLSDTQDASLATSLFSVADTSWTETGINFNNAPAVGASALVTATITGTTLQMVQFDVTAYVKAQKAAGHNIVSFALKGNASSNSFLQFNSREAGTQAPALVVT